MSKYYYFFTALIFSTLLCACAGSRTIEVQGQKAIVVDCSGHLLKMSLCYKKAQELCPQGYYILSHEIPEYNPFPMYTPLGVTRSIVNSTGIGDKKGLVIKCSRQ